MLRVQLKGLREEEALAQLDLQDAMSQVQQLSEQLNEADENLHAEQELRATLTAEAAVKSGRLARIEGRQSLKISTSSAI